LKENSAHKYTNLPEVANESDCCDEMFCTFILVCIDLYTCLHPFS